MKPEFKEKLFDDLARAAGSAVGAVSGLSRQIKQEIRVRVDEMAQRMDLVPREDFDDLQARFDALEKRVATLESTSKPAKKSPAKKTTSKKKASA